MTAPSEALLSIENLRVQYRGPKRTAVTAVDDVSLWGKSGETIGLVGESGSGKTTVGNAALGLAPIAGGRILFQGEDITHAFSMAMTFWSPAAYILRSRRCTLAHGASLTLKALR